MNLLRIAILGILQGLTEFFPVSSSGHLVLADLLLKIEQPALFTNIVLHVSTVCALVIFFRREILDLFITGEGRKYLKLIILASVPTAVIGLKLEPILEKVFFRLEIVCLLLSVSGIIAAVTYFKPKKSRTLGVGLALIIGIVQGIAVIPGISRSGITIATGLLAGLEPKECYNFSFLLSIPAIVGAFLLKIIKCAGIAAIINLESLIGFLLSFIVGYLTLEILQRLVLKRKLYYFAFYLWILSAAVLLIKL